MKVMSKELEARFRKARNPVEVEISGDLTVQARTTHFSVLLASAT